MHLMAGLERPASGRIIFDGTDVTGVSVQKRNVSMVYQQFINYPNFTVFENIASPLRVAGFSDAEIKRRIGDVADLLKLSPMLDRKPSELSGGQQQRTAMARALVKDSDLVLLDEPLANLDFKLREELREELPRLLADRNCVVVYATTEPTEALLFGGHTATLHEGRVTQFGPTGDIYREPDDLISARVFSEPPINTAPLVKQGARFRFGESLSWPVPAKLKSSPDGKYTLGLRPHHVTAQKHKRNAVAVSGEVLVTEISGSESVVHMNVDGNTWISLSHGIHAHEVGSRATVFADMASAYYFAEDGARADG
jgi:glycerol transport system ATP-binding protein